MNFDDQAVRFAQWQLEKCPDTQRLHHQGYIQLKAQKGIKWMKSHIHSTCHFASCAGSEQANDLYTSKCTSKVEGPWTYGEKATQGSRTDIKAFVDNIKEGGLKRAITEMPEVYMKYHNGAEKLAKFFKPTPVSVTEITEDTLYSYQKELVAYMSEKPKRRRVFWIWSSESNTGKTELMCYCENKFKLLPGEPHDMKRTLYAFNDHEIIWFDTARSQPHDASFLSQIEQLSNMKTHLSTMYVPDTKLVVAHIVVSSNRPPPEKFLPERLVEIKANKDVY